MSQVVIRKWLVHLYPDWALTVFGCSWRGPAHSLLSGKLLALRQNILLLYDRWHNASAVMVSKRGPEHAVKSHVARSTSGRAWAQSEAKNERGR
jgi:hypothetical protein